MQRCLFVRCRDDIATATVSLDILKQHEQQFALIRGLVESLVRINCMLRNTTVRERAIGHARVSH